MVRLRHAVPGTLQTWSSLVFLWTTFQALLGFNVDLQSAKIFKGPRGSFFGLSVTLHRNNYGKWLLVGAPRSQCRYQWSLRQPGALYKCPIGQHTDECQQVKLDVNGNQNINANQLRYSDMKDGQWLGVALDSHESGNGSVVVCAHLWKDIGYSGFYLPNGACYEINGDLNYTSVRRWLPLVELGKQITEDGVYLYAMGQAGMAAKYSEGGRDLILGAPGFRDWTGAVIHYINGKRYVITPPSHLLPDSYIGYSVSSGKFFNIPKTYYVTGAPRMGEFGRLYIYQGTFEIRYSTGGKQMGSYFGMAVAAVDMNNDGLDDLLVGAPLYRHSLGDEGRVYFFMNYGYGNFKITAELTGSNSKEARFGSAIAKAGDINKDGLQDVIIGAPYENGRRGAIYIYHGDRNKGVRETFGQRIAAEDLNPTLRGFGYSISKTRDIDGNSYEDLAVGAYISDQAVVLRVRPVIHLLVTLTIDPHLINLNHTNCLYRDKHATCVVLTATFKYSGQDIPSNIDVGYEVDVDTGKRMGGSSPRAKILHVHGESHKNSGSITLHKNRLSMKRWKMVLSKSPRDVVSPFYCNLSYHLITSSINLKVNTKRNDSVSHPLMPMLNADSTKPVRAEANFERRCGVDNKCVTDLQLKVFTLLPRSRSYLVLGEARNLQLEINIANIGEPSYMTEIDIRLPPELSFIRLTKSRRGGHVACSQTPPDQLGPGEGSAFLCDAGNPIHAFSKKTFYLTSDMSNLDENQGFVNMTFIASTRSRDLSLDNNNAYIKLQIKLDAKFEITGVSHLEQIFFEPRKKNDTKSKEDAESGSKQRTEGEWSTVTHLYDIVNMGPGTMPPSSIEIQLPHFNSFYPGPFAELDNIQLSSDNRGEDIGSQCHVEGPLVPRAQQNVSSSNHGTRQSALFTDEERQTVLNCETSQCLRYVCSIGWIAPQEGLLLSLKFRIHVGLFAEQESPKSLTIASQIVIRIPNHHLFADMKDRTYLHSVVTEVHPTDEETYRRLEYWILLVSAAAGVLGLIVIACILRQAGFFRRRELEEMQRLLRESGDIPQNGPEEYGGHDNKADDTIDADDRQNGDPFH